jgi:hypothetical protein
MSEGFVGYVYSLDNKIKDKNRSTSDKTQIFADFIK